MQKEIAYQKKFRQVKVNHLNFKDRKLAYKNYMNYYINESYNYCPLTKEELLDESVANLFPFGSSKEGHVYWFKAIDNVLAKQKKIKEYKEEKFYLQLKQFFIYLFFCLICCITFGFLMLYIIYLIKNL
jgi:hypothetical protein